MALTPEQIEHPTHYNHGQFETWDVLDDWFPTDPLLWQAGRYLSRLGHKDDPVTEVGKIKQYLDRWLDKQQRPDDDKPATGATLWKPFPSSHAYIVYRDLEAVSQACDRNALTCNSWLVDRFGGIVLSVAELRRTDSGPYLRVPIDSSIIPSVPGEVAEEWVFFPKEELDFSKAEQ